MVSTSCRVASDKFPSISNVFQGRSAAPCDMNATWRSPDLGAGLISPQGASKAASSPFETFDLLDRIVTPGPKPPLDRLAGDDGARPEADLDPPVSSAHRAPKTSPLGDGDDLNPEVAVPRGLFEEILWLTAQLRALPAPA